MGAKKYNATLVEEIQSLKEVKTKLSESQKKVADLEKEIVELKAATATPVEEDKKRQFLFFSETQAKDMELVLAYNNSEGKTVKTSEYGRFNSERDALLYFAKEYKPKWSDGEYMGELV